MLQQDDEVIPIIKVIKILGASEIEIKYWLRQNIIAALRSNAACNDGVYYVHHYTDGNIHENYCSLREVQAKKTASLPRLMSYQEVITNWKKNGDSEETLNAILAANIDNSKCRAIGKNGDYLSLTFFKQRNRAADPVLLTYDDGLLSPDFSPGATNAGDISSNGKCPYEDFFFIRNEIEAITREYFDDVSETATKATLEKLLGDFIYQYTRGERPKESKERVLEAYNQQALPEYKIFSINASIFKKLYPKKKNPKWGAGAPRKA